VDEILYIVGGLLLVFGSFGTVVTRSLVKELQAHGRRARVKPSYAFYGVFARAMIVPYLFAMAVAFQWWAPFAFVGCGAVMWLVVLRAPRKILPRLVTPRVWPKIAKLFFYSIPVGIALAVTGIILALGH
jgi:hypothetical protein